LCLPPSNKYCNTHPNLLSSEGFYTFFKFESRLSLDQAFSFSIIQNFIFSNTSMPHA
jgi:hypothetical protein